MDMLFYPGHEIRHVGGRLLSKGLPYLASYRQTEFELPNIEIFSTQVNLIICFPVSRRIGLQAFTRFHDQGHQRIHFLWFLGVSDEADGECFGKFSLGVDRSVLQSVKPLECHFAWTGGEDAAHKGIIPVVKSYGLPVVTQMCHWIGLPVIRD